MGLAICVFISDAHADPPDLMRSHAVWMNHRPELRHGVEHAVWREDSDLVFELQADCPSTLDALGVDAHALGFRPTPAPEPVVLDGPVGGVTFIKQRESAPFIVSCSLAQRLPQLAEVFADHGIDTVVVSSALRREPAISFHHLGMALDIRSMSGGPENARVEWDVERDYVGIPDAPTCPMQDGDVDPIRGLMCDLFDRGQLNTVIGPDYGRGHDNHLHIDIRPGDARQFLR